MNIERDTEIRVTLPYTYVDGQIGKVAQPPEDTSDLYSIILNNGQSVSLYESEFEVYVPKRSPLEAVREELETKIEEFKEKLPEGRLVHEEEHEAYDTMTGLKLALEIVNRHIEEGK